MPDEVLTDDHMRQIAHGQERPTLAMTHRLAADLVTARDSLREARERLAALEGRVWSDLAPPGGWVCAVCGVPVESEPCSEHEPPAVRLELAEAWIAHLEGAYGIPADARERWMRLRAAGALETASPSPEPATAPESRSHDQAGELEGCSGCAPAPLPPDIESAKARIAELEAALRDFAEHGTRHDLTPTNISSSPEQRRAQLEGYIRSMDASVRTRARTALTQAGETTAPKGELGEVRG
ncbi:hypothetical protein IU433_12345 [Nocardia puris]|uniref:hypothetical protein n=1 Tax=Nocardia puris TaxID=208602 RepID=UPI00189324B8|nr:hypothetical protein [Nocardia puris]MBF6459827.1 hypothetical protein [Nocardia puris]